MNAKERLREVIDGLSEAEAAVTLEYIAGRRQRVPVAPAAPVERSGEEPAGARPRTAESAQVGQPRSGLRTMAVVPVGILFALFIGVYGALLLIVAIVVIRG